MSSFLTTNRVNKLIVLNTPSPRSKVQKRVLSSSSSKRNSTLTSINTSTTTNNTNTTNFTTAAANLQELNQQQRMIRFNRNPPDLRQCSYQELERCLQQKEEMLEFYRTEEARRKQRFRREKGHRVRVLEETLSNLNNLLSMEIERNRKLQAKIQSVKAARNRQQQECRQSAGSTNSIASDYFARQMVEQLGNTSAESALLDNSKSKELINMYLPSQPMFLTTNTIQQESLLLEKSGLTNKESSVLTLTNYI